MEPIVLDFKGYRLENGWDSLEDVSAIYCIYSCIYDKEDDVVRGLKLLYIGESEELKTRVTNADHKGIKKARKRLRDGETLCLSYVPVDGRSRKRLENALIFEHQPICCEDDKYTYTHETVSIKTKGKSKGLHKEFTVKKGSKIDA